MRTATPDYSDRLEVMRKTRQDVASGVRSIDSINAHMERVLRDPVWEPIPVHQAGLHEPYQVMRMLSDAMAGNQLLSKAVSNIADTSGNFYIRPDVEAALYVNWLNKFPLWDFLPRTPAVGQLHPFRIETGVGSAAFISELDNVPADHAVGAEVVARMACAATQRGASLMEDYVAMASGGTVGGGTPSTNERDAGMRAVAQGYQAALVYGTRTTGHSGDVSGVTMTNAFEGFRILTNNEANVASALYGGLTPIPPVEVLPASGTPTSPTRNNLYAAVQDQVIAIGSNGGTPDLIICGPKEAARFLADMPAAQRVFVQPGQRADVTVGFNVTRVAVGNYLLDLLVLPGGMGTYAVSGTHLGNGGAATALTGTASDMVVLDRSAAGLGWLGQETPIALQNSYANDQLSNRWLIAGFYGPIYHHPNWIASVRVQQGY